MVITWYGEGCFKIQSGDYTILIDPFDFSTGLTPPRLKPNILLKTLVPLPISFLSNNTDESTVKIFGAGEYNFNDINISGFALAKESNDNFLKSIYLAEIESLKLCFLGHASEIPESAIQEHLEEMDILFIPAGGSPFISQKTAVQFIKNFEPKIVIPSFYKISSLKRKSDDLQEFLEEMHQAKAMPQEKLTIKRKEVMEIKATQVIPLKI